MKTPLSPAQLMEEDPPACYPPPACAELEEAAGGPGDACGPRRLLYSLCEVCNIQLNSAAQAQIHYNGKSHLRRVKQLNHTEGSPAGAGVPPPPHALGGSTGKPVHLPRSADGMSSPPAGWAERRTPCFLGRSSRRPLCGPSRADGSKEAPRGPRVPTPIVSRRKPLLQIANTAQLPIVDVRVLTSELRVKKGFWVRCLTSGTIPAPSLVFLAIVATIAAVLYSALWITAGGDEGGYGFPIGAPVVGTLFLSKFQVFPALAHLIQLNGSLFRRPGSGLPGQGTPETSTGEPIDIVSETRRDMTEAAETLPANDPAVDGLGEFTVPRVPPPRPPVATVSLQGTNQPVSGEKAMMGLPCQTPQDRKFGLIPQTLGSFCTNHSQPRGLWEVISSSSCSRSSGHNTSLPSLVRTPPLMMQSSLDMKPFMPFPVDSSTPVGLFANFSTVFVLKVCVKVFVLKVFVLKVCVKVFVLKVFVLKVCVKVFVLKVFVLKVCVKVFVLEVFVLKVFVLKMDPVQKAVINHTFGVSIPPKKKQVISCNICQLRFNSDSQAEAHYKGSKHAKKLKAQETTKPRGGPALDATAQPISTVPAPSGTVTDSSSDQSEKSVEPSAALSASAPPRPFTSATAAPPNPPPTSVLSNPPLASSGQPVEAAGQAPSLRSAPKPAGRAELGQESEEEKAKKLLYCSLCKVAVNSLSQLEAHNTGSKHKTMLEARNGAGPIKAYPRPGSKLKMQANILKGSGLQNKTFHCEICDVHVNSEIQLKQHISSRRHKDRVAGKPLKPKYSPYNKQHRGSISLAKLAFQKDLMKPISPSFLSTPFSPTTMPSISLHPRPNASIFQTATLPASFLRAAPGPIRPSTGSILFAPY
ncbi:hypothetical protein P4O66_015086 [Electrophorus voltai]|uniref:Zinc finger protein 385B n=1 Tax=Electrophorus voltai TaxID=2609070 RepID=A0AAD9DQM9_9TELE|nr:hypothetical protein P4O66_015086 [Electrophorus voltai]